MNPEWADWYDVFYSTAGSGAVELYVDEAKRANGPLLEIGVGTGRIAIPAAKAGVEVVGIDSSREMLAVAERKARAAAPLPGGLTLTHADMTALELGRHDFSLAIIPENTLLMATRHDGRVRTLCCAARHLRPGGRLMFSVFVPDPELLYDESDAPVPIGEVAAPVESHHYRLSAYNRFDHDAQLNHATQVAEEVDPDGRVVRRVELTFELAYLWPHQVFELVEEAGLDVIEVWGDDDRSPFTGESELMIVVAAARGAGEVRAG